MTNEPPAEVFAMHEEVQRDGAFDGMMISSRLSEEEPGDSL